MKSDGVIAPLKDLDEFESRIYESFSYLGMDGKPEVRISPSYGCRSLAPTPYDLSLPPHVYLLLTQQFPVLSAMSRSLLTHE